MMNDRGDEGVNEVFYFKEIKQGTIKSGKGRTTDR